jgi:trigger factor
MPVTIEDAGVCKKKLKFEIAREDIDKKMDTTLDELSKTAQIPGFRPGHAPRRLIQRKLAQELADQVKAELIADEYKKAVEEHKLEILREEDFDPDKIELPKDGPLTFEVEVEVKPEVALPDYSKIDLEVRKVALRDEDVQQAMDNLRRSRGRFVEQKDGAKAEERDMLTADVKVVVGDEVLHDQQGMSLAVFPQAVGGLRIEKLVDELKGKKAGSKVEFSVTVPETFEKEALRGQEATVTVAIQSIRRIELPPLDDTFAKSVGMETVADVEKAVRERIEADLTETRDTARRAAMADWLLKQVQLEVPAGVAEANAGRVFNQQVMNLQRQGVPLETLQERAEELMTACRGRAAQDLKLDFIFAAIAKKENLTTTEDELQARVSLLAQNYGRPVERMYEDLEKRGYLSALREQILTDKVYALLLGKATITEVEPKAEEPAAEEKKESNESAEKPKTKKSPARKKTAKKDADKADDETT